MKLRSIGWSMAVCACTAFGAAGYAALQEEVVIADGDNAGAEPGWHWCVAPCGPNTIIVGACPDGTKCCGTYNCFSGQGAYICCQTWQTCDPGSVSGGVPPTCF